MKSTHPATVDSYIAGFPKDIRTMLSAIRSAVRKAAPASEETIKYGIPTYVLHGNLLSFAAWKTHIGFYPAPLGVESFKRQLAPYKGSKSTAKFLLDNPLPLALITRMVKYNVKKNLEKAKAK